MMNIHPVTTPNFHSSRVDVVTTNPAADGRYDWGEPFGSWNCLQRIATGDGQVTTVNYRIELMVTMFMVFRYGTYDGNAFELNIDGVETPQTLWAEADYINDDGDLIVDFDPVYTADYCWRINPDVVLEPTLSSHVNNAVYKLELIGQLLKLIRIPLIDWTRPGLGLKYDDTGLGGRQYCL